MSVMKTCCGCFSTKSGTLIILMMYSILYLIGIIFSAIYLNSDDSSGWLNKNVEIPPECEADQKDSWWCKLIKDSSETEKSSAIGHVVVDTLLLVATIIALAGTCIGNALLLMPFIVLEFLVLAMMALFVVLVSVVLGVYQPGDVDITTAIAVAVVGVMILAFAFYLWLCVVSHYQILKEISQLGHDKVQIMQYPYNDPNYTDPTHGDYTGKNELDDVDDPAKYETPRTNTSTLDVKEDQDIKEDKLVDVDTPQDLE